MEHAVAHPFPARSREPLDASRIAANAGTILVNAALLLLLLVPLSEPLQPLVTRDEVIELFEVPRPKLPPPVPIDPLPVVRPPVTPTQREPRALPVMPTEQHVVVDPQPGDIAIEPAEVVPDAGASIEPVPAAAGAQLQALRSPPPAYPGEALRAGLMGVVELEILVGVDGRPLEARVVRSSGHRVLDQAARRTVLSKWTFVPAMRDGQPVQALGRVPIEFTLD